MIIGTMFSIMFFFKTCNTNQTPALDLNTGAPLQVEASHKQALSHDPYHTQTSAFKCPISARHLP